MSKKALVVLGEKSFEDLKHLNQHGAEYWNAHELQPILGYSQWRRFEDAIKRAIISCEKSGNVPANHFAGAGKMVGLGSEKHLKGALPKLDLANKDAQGLTGHEQKNEQNKT